MFIKESDQRERRTRNMDTLSMVVPFLRTTQGRKSFSYHGPYCWNSLDQPIRMIESINVFKNDILKLLMWDVNHPG